ncbi:MAG: ABC transporter ATP-binding protein [Candidatus Odinarchaeota archaeon]
MNDDKDNVLPVQLEGISKLYRMGAYVVNALNDITLSVNQGDFMLVMGPSGSGKSTLLNIIAGLESPSTGEVRITNKILQNMNDRQLCEIRRFQIGIIFQFFNLHPTLTALENVELPMLIAGRRGPEREEKARQLLEIVGLNHRINHYPHELSGGEKQRVGIARSLANDPSVLLADEPTGDMDSATGREIINLMFELNQQHGKTVVCVTHDEEMLKPGMRIIRMEDGRIITDTHS